MIKYSSSLSKIPLQHQLHPITGDQSWVFGDGRYRIFFNCSGAGSDLVVYLVHIIDNKELNKSIYPGNKIPTSKKLNRENRLPNRTDKIWNLCRRQIYRDSIYHTERMPGSDLDFSASSERKRMDPKFRCEVGHSPNGSQAQRTDCGDMRGLRANLSWIHMNTKSSSRS